MVSTGYFQKFPSDLSKNFPRGKNSKMVLFIALLSAALLQTANSFITPVSPLPQKGYYNAPSYVARVPVVVHSSTPYSTTGTRGGDNKRSRYSTTSIHSTWSRRGGEESRFGVRKRVRAVLAKAKNRTGISNVNSESLDLDFSTERSAVSDYAESYFTERGTAKSPIVDQSNLMQNVETISNDKPYKPSNGKSLESVAADSKPVADKLSFSNKDDDANENNKKAPKDSKKTSKPSKPSIEVDPLPFTLPKLNDAQLELLSNGQRVQEQSRMGREGSGFVVMDIPAPDYVIWEALLDFEAYPENIGTVRSMRMFTNTHLEQSYIAEKPVLPGTGRETRHYGTGSITRASFVLSKFKLNIAAIHKYKPHPDGHYMEFTLDKANKNLVLKDAKGTWYTQTLKDAHTGQEFTRVWLLCDLQVSPVLPQFIVDYAAKKAMPRATNWLMPTVERLRKEFKIDEDSFLA